MPWTEVVAALAFCASGILMGLLGGGGSILSVPIFAYVLGASAHDAVTRSLLVVGATSFTVAVPGLRSGRVDVRTGLVFGASSMVGAWFGSRLAAHLEGVVILIGFAILMIATAVAMMRGRAAATKDAPPVARGRRLAQLLVQGVGVGLLTGIVGAGGGFIVVPALVLLARLDMRRAVATSTFVIALNTLAALAGRYDAIHVDRVTLGYALLSSVAGLAGVALGSHIAPERLRRAFGVFVLVMGVLVLAREAGRLLAP